ncbi:MULTISPECIES: HAD family hydrolase [unclassified Hyphomicrobium]|uniref:HAD family hydrolase n=1 Tax=unclassified Hyphomicrobium TaxID=2619925 RepID=UPI000213E6CE|nr:MULTISPECIES: HAD family hydrolase [unclassified Hyphomicrobium]CCB67142.1 putative HAD-superfamily hydrolase, subfamily IA, variant 1 [Hyphomicrobium sp. MC1]
MQQIKGLLFDKDGTILDFYKTWIPINRRMALDAAGGDPDVAADLLRASGHDPDTDIVEPGALLIGADAAAIAEHFAGFLKNRTSSDLFEVVSRNFREGGAKHAMLIDGATDEIKRLRRAGYRLGLATNDTFDGMQASLGRFSGILDLFEFCVGSDSGHGAKPDPGMGLAFAQHTGLDPEDCAIIGDSIHDLEMGRRAGFGLRIAVLSGPYRQVDLEPYADVVIGSVLELGALFNLPAKVETQI